MTPHPTLRPPRLVPLRRPAVRPDDARCVAWIAQRLFAAHAGEPVHTLEALAAALANRLRMRTPGTPELPPAPDGDPRYRVCRRIARRTWAGGAAELPAGADAFHRIGALPGWARDLQPVVERGGFLFYVREA